MARTIPALYQQVARLFLAAIPAPQTPEMIGAVSAWELQELGTVPQITANNPWNLHGVKGDYGGLAIGDWYAGPGDVHVAVFGSLADGVAASVMNLRAHGSDFARYDKVLAAAKSGEPIAFLDALAASAWSAGRYGTKNGGPNALVAIYRTLALPAPAQAPTTGGSTVPASTKPTAGTPAAEPIVYAGIITGILVAAGFTVTDAANLTPALVAVIGAIPVVISLIARQFVTPNGSVPVAIPAVLGTTTDATPTPVIVAPSAPVPLAVSTVVSRTPLPAGTQGTIDGTTRRFDAEAPYTELDPAQGSHLMAFTAEVVFANSEGHAPHGTYWETGSAKSAEIAKADITPAAAAVPPAVVPVTETPSAPIADPYADKGVLQTNAEIVAFESQPGIAVLEDAAWAAFNPALAAYQAARGHKPGSAEPQSVLCQIASSVNASILSYAGKFGPTDNTYSR